MPWAGRYTYGAPAGYSLCASLANQRYMKMGLGLWVLLFALALQIVGCGGGKENGIVKNGLPIATSGGTLAFTSSAQGYAIELPSGWMARENFTTFAGKPVDVFLSSDQIDGF